MNDLVKAFQERLYVNVNRDLRYLFAYLEGTDFYSAPASTKYHGACVGGLLQHSLCVHGHLLQLNNLYKTHLPFDSMAICALLHDVCKADCYELEWKNRKNYDPDYLATLEPFLIKHDARGDYAWESYEGYTFNEKFKFGGHGSKSVFLVSRCLRLTDEEAAAINCHMGAYDKSTYSDPSAVYAENKLAFLLHLADECATFLSGV